MVAEHQSSLQVRLATSDQDIQSAQRLRYRVFVEELGGDGPYVDHENRLERDQFDPHCTHLVLVDPAEDPEQLNHVVGVYRLFDDVAMRAVGCFYTESEFDLTALKRSGRRLLELGRSCLHPDHRGGSAMYLLWNALAEYVLANKIEILFGTASFHGTDVEDLKAPLSLLHHRHLAPHALRVAAIGPTARPMDLVPMDQIDRRAAMVAIPALIKAYLRLGGCVGEGAFIDYDFNTTDVCLIMDTAALNVRQRDIYMKARR